MEGMRDKIPTGCHECKHQSNAASHYKTGKVWCADQPPDNKYLNNIEPYIKNKTFHPKCIEYKEIIEMREKLKQL